MSSLPLDWSHVPVEALRVKSALPGLGLQNRFVEAMKKLGIVTIADLERLPRFDLLKQTNIGPSVELRIEEALRELGLCFKDSILLTNCVRERPSRECNCIWCRKNMRGRA